MSEDILRKIRALLTQAEDKAATAQEAEAFSRKAEALMQKYSIDQALLSSTKVGAREVPTFTRFEFEDAYARPKNYLLAGIVKAFGGRIVKTNRDGDSHLRVFAFPQDMLLIETLYTSLLLQASHAVLAAPQSDRSFRTSFWYAFAGRVHTRLQAERTQATVEATGASTSLVLASREEQVDAAVAAAHPNLRTGRQTRTRLHSAAGARAGREAAERANLGHTSLQNTRRAIG